MGKSRPPAASSPCAQARSRAVTAGAGSACGYPCGMAFLEHRGLSVEARVGRVNHLGPLSLELRISQPRRPYDSIEQWDGGGGGPLGGGALRVWRHADDSGRAAP